MAMISERLPGPLGGKFETEPESSQLASSKNMRLAVQYLLAARSNHGHRRGDWTDPLSGEPLVESDETGHRAYGGGNPPCEAKADQCSGRKLAEEYRALGQSTPRRPC
jgi:hypothetical protein